MRRKIILYVFVGMSLQGLLTNPLPAQGQALDGLLDGIMKSAGSSGSQSSIDQAFKDVLGRKPSEREAKRYRSMMEDENWTEEDIRDDLRQRDDYRRHSDRKGQSEPELIVRRAYEDILGREPDQEGMRIYRSRIIDDDWSEQEVRDDLRKSPERAKRNAEIVDRIIRRAYEDILGREADPSGLSTYRNKMLNDGWDEQDVRSALKKSREHREKGNAYRKETKQDAGKSENRVEKSKGGVTKDQAQQIVRRAYQSVLGRDPDAGSAVYVDKILNNRWGEAEVVRELRNSPEYRKKHGK